MSGSTIFQNNSFHRNILVRNHQDQRFLGVLGGCQEGGLGIEEGFVYLNNREVNMGGLKRKPTEEERLELVVEERLELQVRGGRGLKGFCFEELVVDRFWLEGVAKGYRGKGRRKTRLWSWSALGWLKEPKSGHRTTVNGSRITYSQKRRKSTCSGSTR